MWIGESAIGQGESGRVEVGPERINSSLPLREEGGTVFFPIYTRQGLDSFRTLV